MTKLLILSDSHNSASAVERILHAESDANAVVFLGDGLRDLEEALTLHPKMKVYAVAGNCDFGALEPLDFFQRVPGNIENDASHHLAGGVFPVEGNDALPVCVHEGGEVGVLRIHAQGVVKLLEEIPHHLLDSLEIQHHVIGIQRFRSEHHFHGARMAMREFAITGMFGQKMPAFQFDGFANSVDHGGRITWARVRGNPNQSLSGSHFVSYVGMGLCCSGCFWAAFPCAWPRFLADFKKTIFLPYGLSFMIFPENGGEGGA